MLSPYCLFEDGESRPTRVVREREGDAVDGARRKTLSSLIRHQCETCYIQSWVKSEILGKPRRGWMGEYFNGWEDDVDGRGFGNMETVQT